MLPFFLLGILLVPGKYFPLRQYTPKNFELFDRNTKDVGVQISSKD